MKFDIFMDLDEFDKKILSMTEEQKKKWVFELDVLERMAKKLLDNEKISKITYNRIRRLWGFSPYQRVELMPSKKFNSLFGIKNPNLKYIYNAINEVLSKSKEGKKK